MIWFLCRQDWMDEPSPRGDTGGVAKEIAGSLFALGKLSHEDISKGTGLPLEVVEELAA